MSDAFERAVRDAAAKLGEPAAAPSYHASWQQGVRRRFAKRAALAGLGIAAFAALFVVDLDRLPGRDTFETDDVAIAVNAVPADAGTAADTDSGLTADAQDLAQDPAASGDTDQSAQTDDASPSATPVGEPVAPVPTGTAVPGAAGQPAVTPTMTPLPASPLTPVPTSTPSPIPPAATSPSPTPLAATAPPTTTADPGLAATVEVAPSPDPTPTSPSAVAATPTPAATDVEVPTLTAVPTPLAAATDRPADAVILGPGAFDTEQKCATLLDGTDSSCKLLQNYPCQATDVPRPDYQAVDSTGDGMVDECVSTVETYCDLTGDGLGDVPCKIEPVNSVAPVAPEG